MNGSSDFVRLATTLVFTVSGLIAGFATPVHCQEALRVQPGAEAQLTAEVWVPTGSLNTARSGHTATLLSNGKVLVVGGALYDNSAELYDPATGTWSLTGQPHAGRVAHTATMLPNGQVLVAGGQDSKSFLSLQSAELYDPDTGTWRLTGSMTTGRSEHTATLLQTGKVLVAGGGTSGLAQTELYDPASGTWSGTGGLITPRVLHQATLLQDGRVLVTGGTTDDDNFPPLAAWELYDPAGGTWSSTATSNIARHVHTATLLFNGMVLVAGSPSVAELFDPRTGQSGVACCLNVGRYYHTASLLSDGSVLVAGGLAARSPFEGSNVALSSAEVYDPSTGKWGYTSNLNTARSRHTATLLANGKVLIAGGIGANGILNSAELYGQPLAPGTIGPGFTGSWYDPAQSGHGIFVQILSGQRFYASWFAFSPAGAQAWFTGVGTYGGNTATITDVELPTGGRWIPNFDPSQIVRNAWGTLTFTFTDCDHGRVDFNSVLGYGVGSMNLTRLTQPATLTCP